VEKLHDFFMVFPREICYDAVKSKLAWHIHNLPTRYVPIPNKIYAMQIRKALFSPVECLSLFLGTSRGVPYQFFILRENSIFPPVGDRIFSNPSWFSVALFINVCYAINIGFAWSYSVELFLPPFHSPL
jgi:hypothetical protein